MDLNPNAHPYRFDLIADLVGNGETATIHPTNDLLLIRPIAEDAEVTTGWGFVLPATEDHVDTPLRGLVLAAGLGRPPKLSSAGARVVKALEALLDAPMHLTTVDLHRLRELRTEGRDALAAQAECPDRVPMQVKVGDTVIYSRHGFQTFRIGGEDLIVTQEASILGVIDSEASQ